MGMRSLAVGVTLVLATSALAGCGSNDSTANELARQDQLRQARADAARAQRQSDKLQQLEQQVKKNGGSGGAPAPSSTSSGSTPSSTGTHSCGGGLSAGSNTTCGFARNVQSAYNDTGGGDETVAAYSTATGKIYTMTCHTTASGHECHGGNRASVYFP